MNRYLILAARHCLLQILVLVALVVAAVAATPITEKRVAAPPNASYRLLHLFTGAPKDGAHPFGPVLLGPAGTLYGTVSEGGSRRCGGQGCGAVYRLTPTSSGYAEQLVYSFLGGKDGSDPEGGLVADASGDLFGTTRSGGSNACSGDGCGTVFELRPTGSGFEHTILHRFTGPDGADPRAALALDGNGDLFGDTAEGGTGYGTVFELTPVGHKYGETVLHAFNAGYSDGQYPDSNVILNAQGELFGTTPDGGSNGLGAAFRITSTSSGSSESLIYSFGMNQGDGWDPEAGLTAGASGTLYGTTSRGGKNKLGTAFALVHKGGAYSEGVLYSFGPAPDAHTPYAPLLLDPSGALYGTSLQGGSHGGGTVYKLTPKGHAFTETVVYSLPTAGSAGSEPYAPVVSDGTSLYGTTWACGSGGCGTVFQVTP